MGSRPSWGETLVLATVARRRALAAAVLAAAVAVGGVAAGGPASASVDTSVLEITGDAGDALTHGVAQSLAPPATPIDVSGTSSSVQVSVGSGAWAITFQAPAGQELAVGTTYSNAVKPADANGPEAGFDLATTETTCTTVSASFTVLDLALDADTGAVTGFAASFLSKCNGSGALAQGVVYAHSSLTYQAVSTMTFTAPASSFAGGSLDLAGTLAGPGGPIAGAAIAVTRLVGGVTTSVADATTAADGTWTATVPFPSSNATYTAAYAGDADHAAVQKQRVVTLRSPETSTLSLSGPASTFVSTSVDVAGVLSGPGGPIAGATIALSRTDGSGSTNLPSTVTADDGSYSANVGVGLTDATFHASYAGDAQHATVQQDWAVTAVARATSTLTVTGPTSALATSSVDLTGTLSGTSGAVAGATVSLSRTDSAGTTSVGTATTAADGTWTATVALGLTDATFTASYAGDSAHDAVTATASVVASRNASAMTLTAPTTVVRGVAYTVSGTLTSGGSPLGDQLVALRRTDLAGTSAVISVRTDANGAFSYRDAGVVGGVVTWRATWTGDATHASSDAIASLTLTRLRTAVTIKAVATSWAYGSRVTVTVHLGPSYDRRDVYVYARPLSWGYGGSRLISHVKVDSRGNAVVRFSLRSRTTFVVRFDGDQRYEAASGATTSPKIKPLVAVSLSGYYKKVGSLYLFHATDPKQIITVLPFRPGRCYSTTVQAFQAGRWSTVARVSCGRLDFTSRGFATLRSSRPLGIPFRIMASVAADATSYTLAASSPWVYLQFT